MPMVLKQEEHGDRVECIAWGFHWVNGSNRILVLRVQQWTSPSADNAGYYKFVALVPSGQQKIIMSYQTLGSEILTSFKHQWYETRV